jgi:hypothetical protein
VIEEIERRILLAVITDPQLNPLTAVPKLHSLPGAQAEIFLDFNGVPAIDDWGGSPVPATPAYDRDGDNTTFTSQELQDMREVWSRVSEKYSPFKIDVTTEDPGTYPHGKVTRVAIGGSYDDWLMSPAGGVALLGSFASPGLSNTCFVFSEDGVFTPMQIAEAAAHEAGHTFGLEHQAEWVQNQLVSQYDPGTPAVAPIMGVSYYSTRGIWRTGFTPSTDSSNQPLIQDDLAVISSDTNGFGYRSDDYGDDSGSATTLTGVNGSISAKGVITKASDSDMFKFNVPAAGSLTISVTPFTLGGMLDASLELTDSAGTVLQTADTASLGETITQSVTAGTYYARVYSHGADLFGGNEGDIGQYELRGTLPAGITASDPTKQQVSGTDQADKISITLDTSGSTPVYKLDLNGTIQTFSTSAVSQFDILAGDGDDVVTVAPGMGSNLRVYVLAGAGNDTINGGDGDDTITGSGGNDLIFGNGGNDRLAGSAGHDYLIGGEGRDRLYGDDGNDVLVGGSGVDRIWGGTGHDVLAGNASADKLYGEDGNDSIYGGDGNDLMDGGVGLDYLYGQDGDDTLYSRDSTYDSVNGGAGTDTARVDPTFDAIESLETLLS